MNIRIGSSAPDFDAESTEGHIRFHQWIGNSWCILFSHPKDFTPVCTTELGYMARLEPDFDRRNCKIASLSVDSVENHTRWLDDIKDVMGSAPTDPQGPHGSRRNLATFDRLRRGGRRCSRAEAGWRGGKGAGEGILD